MGLRRSPTGYMLVRTTRITLYLVPFLVTWQRHEALPGFSQQRSWPQRPVSWTNVHSNATQSAGGDAVVPQSRHNRRRRHVRCYQKLSLGSIDSGIDMTNDAQPEFWRNKTDDDMHVGKVTLTLTMGHGRPPAQALAEPATPGAPFIQHMAPFPLLTHRPGDPPLEREPIDPP